MQSFKKGFKKGLKDGFILLILVLVGGVIIGIGCRVCVIDTCQFNDYNIITEW